MTNVSIAKTQLQRLTSRTEKDLYGLKYSSKEYMPLNEETFFKVKMVCNDNNLSCPIYKYAGKISYKKVENNIYSVLLILAKEHDIYLDYSKIIK